MIVLKKIPHSKLLIIEKAVLHLEQSLNYNGGTQIEKCYCSMAQELYHKYIKPKTTKQYPSKKNSLKMPYHLGSALLLAFNMWQKSNEPNPYQNSVIEQFKTELFKQLL